MAAVRTEVRVRAFGVNTTQSAAGQVRLPYLKHQLPCALSKRHAQRAGETRPDRGRHLVPRFGRLAACLAAATERLITSCSRMWPAPSPVRIG
jgi:hypothetical protein